MAYSNQKRQANAFASETCWVCVLVAVVALMTVMVSALKAEETSHRVGVIYPVVDYPYSRIFDEIIAGIRDEMPLVETFALAPVATSAEVERWAESRGLTSLIALGSGPNQLVGEMSPGVRVIAGGILRNPQQNLRAKTGVSLDPAPSVVLPVLKRLAPRSTHVSIVYESGRWDWFIEQIKEAARGLGIKVDAIPASNLWESATIHKELLSTPGGGRRVLWILPDPNTMDGVLFDSVLTMSWDSEWIVISNTLSHAARGAFMAMYPNNREVGVMLARDAIASKPEEEILPTTSVAVAVNWRTARHLGIALTPESTRVVDLWFPDR